MPDPTTLAPDSQRDHHPQHELATWYGLQQAGIDCEEAAAALSTADPAVDPPRYAAAVAAVAAARAAVAQGWLAYITLYRDDDTPPAGCTRTHLYALTTARRCVLCDQPDTGALSCAGATS